MMVKKILIVFLVLFCVTATTSVSAQEHHFIYVQSDNSQPFYVRLNGQLYSSTASGYVILPKLDNGTFQVNIGFPKNQYPEEAYQISIDGQNEGFLLKYLENNWSLLNIETMALIAGANSIKQPQTVIAAAEPEKIQNDAFSNLLADVVKDSSILKESLPTKLPVEKKDSSVEEIQAVAIPEKSVNTSSTVVAEEIGAEEVNNLNEKSSVATDATQAAGIVAARAPALENPFLRILMVNETGGQDMIYINKQTKDTIRLFMPGSDKKIAKSKTVPKAKIIYEAPEKHESDLTITPTIVSEPEPQNTHSEESDTAQKTAQIIYEPEPEVKKEDDSRKNVVTSEDKAVAANSDCKSIADEKDFLKLQKKMVGQSNSQKMVDVARKFFRAHCYSTDQIRNLSYLFSDDEDKYQFFDAAYPYTSDSDKFYTLQAQLKDPYYINRFKAMIHK